MPRSKSPPSKHRAEFLAWWEDRAGDGALGTLEKMANLMRLSVKTWCELAFYAGQDALKDRYEKALKIPCRACRRLDGHAAGCHDGDGD